MATAKRTRGGAGATERRSVGALLLMGLVALSVLGFAVQGGEYGTTDLVRQRAVLKRLQHEVDSIAIDVQKLELRKQAVEGDPVVQERIAREEFGMVKGDKELLYRFTEQTKPDSTR